MNESEIKNKKMKEHLGYLIEQFKQANGIKRSDEKSQLFISEFTEWIKERQDISTTYIELLDYMGLSYFATPSVVEVGKGSVDSIVMPYDTLIITPYSRFLEELNTENNKRVTNAYFKVVNGKPFKVFPSDEAILRPIKNCDDLTFMTQNPYTPKCIKNWDQLHNNSINDIIVGVYGNIHEKDAETKIKQLKQFRDRLSEPFNEDYIIALDRYCYVIASDRKQKKLFLSK